MPIPELVPSLDRPDEKGLLEFCQRMIQLQSYTGAEGRLAETVKAQMVSLGYDRAWTDGCGNVIGEIRGRHPGPVILFDGHLDTVEVTDPRQWSVPPFGGLVKDGRIHGRGADDMKCALAAMVHGLAPLARRRDTLGGRVLVSGTVCEETCEGMALSRVVEAVHPDFVVIGEASALGLKRGQRGRAEIAVSVTGKAAHSSSPGAGRNAIYMMMELSDRIRRVPATHDPFLGEGLLVMTDILSAPYPGASVVPEKCRATFDRRVLPGETAAGVLDPIRRCVRELQALDPAFAAEVEIAVASQPCYTGEVLSGERFFPAWVLAEDHPLVAGALAGLRAAGLDPAVGKYSFCTNGSYSAGVAGIPTVGFGPGAEDGAHVVDESIAIDQVNQAALGYQAMACQFLDRRSGMARRP